MPPPKLAIRTITSSLAAEDRAHLADLEARVENGFLELAKALHEIKSYKEGLFWKRDHGSFEEYAQARFSYQKQHAYRLARSGQFVSNLATLGSSAPNPLRESQIRPILNKLPEEHQIPCWEELTRERGASELTGELVEQGVQKYRKLLQLEPKKATNKSGVSSEAKSGVEDQMRLKSLDALRSLMAATSHLPAAQEISELLKHVKKLIDG